MSVYKIVKEPDKSLHLKSSPVTEFDDKLKEQVRNMFETLYASGGVGLAAPQVGILNRVFVIDTGYASQLMKYGEVTSCFINPEILSGEGELEMLEGCLSVPDFAQKVKRSKDIKVRYQKLDGEVVEEEMSELLAVVFAHELDHLNGVTLLNKVSNFKRGRYLKGLK